MSSPQDKQKKTSIMAAGGTVTRTFIVGVVLLIIGIIALLIQQGVGLYFALFGMIIISIAGAVNGFKQKNNSNCNDIIQEQPTPLDLSINSNAPVKRINSTFSTTTSVYEGRSKIMECTIKREKGRSLLKKIDDYTVIDLETTGRYVNSCNIIEMSAVRVRNNQIVDTYTTLVNPQENIPYEITELTGITNEMVETAPTIYECIEDFIVFLGDDILLGHNIATFDSTILYDNALYTIDYKLKNDFLDTLRYIKHCGLELPNYKLTTLQKHFGVVNDAQHRSLSDCIATHECYQKMKPLLTKETTSTTKSANKSFAHSADTQTIIMLKGILTGITCDDVLTENEVLSLQSWVNKNRQLAGTYPFDMVISEIDKALEDGVLEKHELDKMLEVFKTLIDPVESFSENSNCSDIDLSGKWICLTGDFKTFESRADAETYFEQQGAVIKSNVIKSLDYLIVGGCGSSNWSCGNYGNKVKKALEMQSKGSAVKIIKEEELMV